MAQDELKFYNKPIPDPIVAIYRRLIDHVRAELVGRVASQTEATYELLAMFHAEYQRLKTSYRALRFEDVTRRLATCRPGRRPSQPELSPRFADRSFAAGRIPGHLAAAVACDPALGRAGDAVDQRDFVFLRRRRQAGDLRLAGRRGRDLRRHRPATAGADAPESERQLPLVPAGHRCRQSDLCPHPGAFRIWAVRKTQSDAGRNVSSRTRRSAATLPGYVELAAAPAADEGQKQGEVTLRYAAERIAELVAKAPGRGVGVLMRRNDGVARLIYELRRLDVPASEEGGNPLADSAAVNVVLSALCLADHPGDTVARFHLAHSPLGPALGCSDYRDDSAATRVSLQVRQQLMQDGYGATIRGLDPDTRPAVQPSRAEPPGAVGRESIRL